MSFFVVALQGVTKGGKAFNFGDTLASNTASHLKGTATAEAKDIDREKLEKVIMDTEMFVTLPDMDTLSAPLPKPAASASKPVYGDDSYSVSGHMVGSAPVPKTTKQAEPPPPDVPWQVDGKVKTKMAQPVNGVVPLKQATLLGQKTKGTDQNSIYRCMALSPSCNLAVRVQSIADGNSHAISIRAEGNFTSAVREALKEAGMIASTSGHYSIHFQTNGVPVSRVIGAFLMGLGLEFEEQIKHVKEIGVSE
ncbi:hypothetical protein WK13_34800 [Burkholderia ubonensis]|nr:hypothetical protein WK13_34800 [Burkholderia ubonensis]